MLLPSRLFGISSITLLSCFELSAAYFIDPSCSKNGVDFDGLKARIDTAFSWANIVINNPDDAKLNDAKQWIFGDNIDITKDGQTDKKWDKALIHFFDLLPDNKTPQQKSEVPDEIIFYCDTSRLKVSDDKNNPRNKSGKKTYDKTTDFGFYGDGVADCASSTGVKAYTAFKGTTVSTIQLCPWYLQHVKLAKFNTLSGFLSRIGDKIDNGLEKLIPNTLFGEAAIDSLALADQTILHELMHTSVGGRAADTHAANSYGWNNVRKISQSEDAWNNAESLAFYGLVTQLVNNGKQVTDKGDVKKAP